MQRFAVFCFLLLCLYGSSDASFNVTLNSGGIVSNILYDIELNIPTFTFRSLGLKVTVTNLTCFDMQAEGIYGEGYTISPLSPSIPGTLYLNATLYAMNISCHANWAYGFNNAGDMNLTLSAGTELSLDVALTQIVPPPPPSVTPSISATPSTSVTNSLSNSISTTNSLSPSPSPSQVSNSPTQSDMPSISPSSSASMNDTSTEMKEIIQKQISKEISKKLSKELEKQAIQMKDASDEITIPQYNISINNCGMIPYITYLHTSSAVLNSQVGVIIDDITPLIPGLVCDQLTVITSEKLVPLLNNLVNITITEYNYIADDAPDQIFNQESFYYGFLSTSLFFLLIFFVLHVIPTCISLYKEHLKYGEGEPLIQDQYLSQTDLTLNRVDTPVPMIMDLRVPWYWRYLILLVLLYNVALFATATSSVASSVFVYITIGPSVIKLPSVFSFKIVSSVIEMWNAGVWPLSLLIGVTSGIWPYVKLVMMFFCYILPPKVLPVKWRKRVLRLLDLLGKWSLIDVYVLCLFINSFRVHIPLSSFAAFDMAVTADYAFYSYVLATVISLALTHVFLFVHDELEGLGAPDHGYLEQLYRHKFTYGDGRVKLRLLGIVSIPIAVILAAIGVLVGSYILAFQLNWEGSIIGNLLELTGQPVTKDFSVISLLMDIPSTSFDLSVNNPGIRSIQVTYAMFVIVFPLLHLTSLLLIWITPLTMQMQKGFYIVVEIFSAWSALDVFIVALIVALLELEQYAAFIVSKVCGNISDSLTSLGIEGDYPPCFTVKATLDSGSWVLAIAVVILLLVSYPVMIICNQAVHDRVNRERERLQNISSPKVKDEEYYEYYQKPHRITQAFVTALSSIMFVSLE